MEAIRKQSGVNSPVGPFRDGVPDDYQIPVAAFNDAEVCARYQRRLSKEGIMSTISSAGGQSRVLVDKDDRQQAAELLREHLTRFPDAKRNQFYRGYDALIVCTYLARATYRITRWYSRSV